MRHRRPLAVLVLLLALPGLAHAAAADLVDLLQKKGVISAPEAKKVRRAPLNRAERDARHGPTREGRPE